MSRAAVLLILALAFPGIRDLAAQEAGTTNISARRWCADSGTACWSKPGDLSMFNGVRIVADLDLSFLFQGGRSRFEGNIQTLPKVALETNLLGGWIALQVGLFAPGTIRLDERSEAAGVLVERQRQSREVHFDFGWVAGLSFLDGSLSAGFGRFHYDRRDFVAQDIADHLLSDSFRYVALQPISSIRANLKDKETDEDDGETP